MFLTEYILLITFSACMFVQLAYFGWFLYTFLTVPESKAKIGHEAGVSVVVALRNEAANLPELIESLANQQYGSYEVILVDDASSDETLDLIIEAASKYNHIHYVWLKEKNENIKGKKLALTLGIKKAKYNIILLTDADCRPGSKFWVARMAQPFLRPNTQIVLGFSGYLKENSWLNAFIQYETLLTAMQYLAFALSGSPYMGVGRNLAYRKDFFLEKKGFAGFSHQLGGDDDLLVNRCGNGKNTRVMLHPDSFVNTFPQKHWNAYYTQKKRHLHAGKSYKIVSKVLLGMFILSYLGSWLFGGMIIVAGEAIMFVIGCWLMRGFVLYVTITSVAKQLNNQIARYRLLILDLFFVIYYISVGLSAFFSKNIKWKI
jgi:glycosyltransferase involved in cell wall biosynthesis